MGFKNYYNSHKQDLQKEIDVLLKLDFKDKLIEHLKTNGQIFLNQIDSVVKF